MTLYLMMILSIIYLLFRRNIIDLRYIKTILVVLIYILITALLTLKLNYLFTNTLIKYLIYYGLFILTVLLITKDKRQAIFYALNILFITNIVNFLSLYVKIWYWYNDDIFNFLIPIITFILFHCKCIDDSDNGLIWNSFNIIVWEILSLSALLNPLNDNVLFITIAIFIIWIIINKLIIIKYK